MIDIFEIELHPLLKRKIAAPGNLPQACQARLNAEASFLPRYFHAHRIAYRQRPWADDTHVTQQNVNELRQLIDAGLA